VKRKTIRKIALQLKFGHPAPEHEAELAACAAVGASTKRQFNETLMGRFRAKQRTADWRNNCNCDMIHSQAELTFINDCVQLTLKQKQFRDLEISLC
jgi:hypothetical protein